MKFQAMAMLAAVGLLAQAKEVQDGQLSPVTVYVQYDVGDARMRTIGKCAEGLASKMFAPAGVQIQWRWGQPKSGEKPILIEITWETPKMLDPGALASARAYEGVHIQIFGDRVLEAGGPSRTKQLMAHVMVHEITHILEGIDRHSENGIMKAHWTVGDILQMQRKPLPFDPYDVVLIHAGLAQSLPSQVPE